ncbi:Atu4866 domain-containing protein [Rhizobium sp. JAB6]|uniref:Atu4866 domain-containing protein n=1 Tax=Rhizobium sp. JAB6 TaxID=2127050 RepID=UPI001FE0C5DA|nr:Atu4866 domain-containing protein [Rhizobium sp. JAB6]
MFASPALSEDRIEMKKATQTYVGMWVTADEHIRHELLPNGRYIEARGNRERAYQGRYLVTNDHIDYWDDTGFTADGDFIDGVLHHAGMILYRGK